jgi:phospholipase/carboxylesterase
MQSFNLAYNFIKAKEEEKNIMVLLHGYGSDKEDLTTLVPLFNLPNTSFYVVNAPFLCPHGFGYEWFPLIFNENSVEPSSLQDVEVARKHVEGFITTIMEKHNLPSNKLSLFGFSQGGIMVLVEALYGKYNYGAVICHSGMMQENPNQVHNNNQPILLLHGIDDEVVSIASAYKTEEFFKRHNLNYEKFYQNNLAHSVDYHTIEQAEIFVKKHLA